MLEENAAGRLLGSARCGGACKTGMSHEGKNVLELVPEKQIIQQQWKTQQSPKRSMSSKTRVHIIQIFLQWGYSLENLSQVDSILSEKTFSPPIAPQLSDTVLCGPQDAEARGAAADCFVYYCYRVSAMYLQSRKTLNSNVTGGFYWMCTAFLFVK